MAMDAFIDAFYEIDTDFGQEITVDELTAYMKKHNYAPQFVDKWLTLFDPENTGVITLDMYCHQLGLEPDDVKKTFAERKEAETTESDELPDFVQIVSRDMTDDEIKDLWKIIKEGLDQGLSGVDLCRHIKQALDAKYGRVWHAITVRGQYWAYYSHEPGCSLILKAGRDIYIMFRTPGW